MPTCRRVGSGKHRNRQRECAAGFFEKRRRDSPSPSPGAHARSARRASRDRRRHSARSCAHPRSRTRRPPSRARRPSAGGAPCPPVTSTPRRRRPGARACPAADADSARDRAPVAVVDAVGLAEPHRAGDRSLSPRGLLREDQEQRLGRDDDRAARRVEDDVAVDHRKEAPVERREDGLDEPSRDPAILGAEESSTARTRTAAPPRRSAPRRRGGSDPRRGAAFRATRPAFAAHRRRGVRPPRAAAACPNEPLPWPTRRRGPLGARGERGELARETPDRRVPGDPRPLLVGDQAPAELHEDEGTWPSEEVLPFLARPLPDSVQEHAAHAREPLERRDDRRLGLRACRSRGRWRRHPSWPRPGGPRGAAPQPLQHLHRARFPVENRRLGRHRDQVQLDRLLLEDRAQGTEVAFPDRAPHERQALGEDPLARLEVRARRGDRDARRATIRPFSP